MRKLSFIILLISITAIFNSVSAQDKFAEVEMQTQHLGGSVYMLAGAGGNIGVSAGPEGLLIIDDQFEPLAERISQALDNIQKGELKYVINTHYHGDHTGSNVYMREVRKATIFAHENVRNRLAAKADHKHAELPVVTYSEGVNFYFNNDILNVIHLANAHTDGDSIVYFKNADVMHAGDLFFNHRFPYIDIDGGGSVAGYIAGAERIIEMISDQTKVIPGHGELGNKADLQRFVDMINFTSQKVKRHKINGLTVEDIIDAGLGDNWKDWSWEFINEEKWIRTLYR